VACPSEALAKGGEYKLKFKFNKKDFDLKKFLKKVKLNEESISMVLGALVIVIVGILVVNYFKDKRSETTPEALTTTNESQIGKTHTVVKGESLWSISEDVYGSGYNWVDVKSANKLESENLEVGQELSLPDVSAKKPTATKKVATISQEVSQAKESISGDSYTIVHGDSLWNIAVRAYGDGYKWVNIAQANNLKNPNIIHTGNVLVLPR
jgi:nucleoid-associated protein YgaU